MTKDQAEQAVGEEYSEEGAGSPSTANLETPELVAEADEVANEQIDPIDALKQEVADMKEQWLRSVAELENVRKRAERDKAETRKYAVTEFARDLTTVCENLHRALDSVTEDMLQSESNPLLKTLHSGVDMTRSELLKAFERNGITRIHPSRGDAFDPNHHQAVSQIEDGSVADGTIAQVIQAGYTIRERLLQPAMVAVAKSTSDAAPNVDTTA